MDGRLRMPKQVIDELKRGRVQSRWDEPTRWASEHEERDSEGAPSADDVKAVLDVVPDVVDHRKESGTEEADPYILAMTVRLRSSGLDARVVTEESRDFPEKPSMSTAAGMLGLPSLPLTGFCV